MLTESWLMTTSRVRALIEEAEKRASMASQPFLANAYKLVAGALDALAFELEQPRDE